MMSVEKPKSQYEYPPWDIPEWINPPMHVIYKDGKYIIDDPEWIYPSDYCGNGGT
jgi:hypothetical protein